MNYINNYKIKIMELIIAVIIIIIVLILATRLLGAWMLRINELITLGKNILTELKKLNEIVKLKVDEDLNK